MNPQINRKNEPTYIVSELHDRTNTVISYPFPRERLTISEPQFSWDEPVKKRLNEICSLPYGWDGYRGRATRWDTANFAYIILQTICKSKTPAPDIVPMPSGGLQIEWHHPEAGDLEIAIYAPYNVKAWVANPREENGEEYPLKNDYSMISPYIDVMG